METIPSHSYPSPPSLASRLARGFFRWQTVRRGLLAGLGLITLLALFYSVENWRGKRAWEACKRELEAKGEVLDWSAFIPPPVPDAQNIFKAPKMAEWFVGKGMNDLLKRLREATAWDKHEDHRRTNGVAEITIAPAKANITPESADIVVEYKDPAAPEAIGKCIQQAFGPYVVGSEFCIFVNRPSHQIQPVRVVIKTDAPLTSLDLETYLVDKALDAIKPVTSINRWRALTNGANSFRLACDPLFVYQAAEYLAWTDPFEADFDLIRSALRRPYARMDGDYQVPFNVQIPNPTVIRDVARTLAQRAQCHLLQGQPESALRELTLLHDLGLLLEAKPTGKPMTLVAAMIHVSVTGIYVNAVADGLRLQAWREPQLIALQAQCQAANLSAMLAGALRGECVAVCHALETTSLIDLDKVYGIPRRLWYAPRGWIYQNMVTLARFMQITLQVFEPESLRIIPRQANLAVAELDRHFPSDAPYSFLASTAIPNFHKAMIACARNQTLVNQGYIACALERYRLAQKHYPETLTELVPEFAVKLPNDIITGQPLHYQRTPAGRFLLYSAGWNETDEGGWGNFFVTRGLNHAQTQIERDWVWP